MKLTQPWELTATEAVRQISRKELSPVELLESCVDRIRSLEPDLRAWVTTDIESARRLARLAEGEVGRGAALGPLHGIPVGIKDIFHTAGMRTSMGSSLFADFVPAQDAAAVGRLKGAGSIMLGKTQTTEFASGDPCETVSPWDPDRTPGGSSSGSAVAVATGMAPLAIGTQTAGSVNRPSAYNGIVGYKPTYGLVSRQGVFPLCWSFDTVGWMARCVEDVSVALMCLSGFDSRDPASVRPPANVLDHDLDHSGGWAPRIGIVAGDIERSSSAEVAANTFTVIEALRSAGAIVELLDLPVSYIGVRDSHLVISNAECHAVHRDRFNRSADSYGPMIRSQIEIGACIPADAYLQAQRHRRQFRIDMDQVMVGIDALIMPATPAPAPDRSTTGDPSFQTPWSFSGQPSVNLPAGISSIGMPLGVQLVGKGFDDVTLLRVARWVEKTLDGPRIWPPITGRPGFRAAGLN